MLCADPTARSGLPAAHWPIAEAAPPGNERCSPEEEVDNMFERIGFGKGHGTLRRLLVKIVGKVGGVRSFVNLVISATTWEKQLRAQSGELPHCILHLAFVFLFGGSAFIFFAIVISCVKIGMIPLVRETVLPGFIRTFGCSAAKLDVYFKNTAGKHHFVRGDEIFSYIEKFGWIEVKQDLIKAGMPVDAKSVQEALLAAASEGRGSQLKKTFDAWRQDTNFVLADAVYEGDMGKLPLLKSCGFDVGDKKEKYTHPEVDRGSPVSFENLVQKKPSFTRDNGILTFVRTLGCVEIQAGLIEAGMPRDAKSVQEALLAAASQGKGEQLKKTFDAWSQDTNFVLADAVYEGDMGKLQLLTTCGFGVGEQKEKYTHPEMNGGSPVTLKDIVSAKHYNRKLRLLSALGCFRSLSALGEEILALLKARKKATTQLSECNWSGG